jgi:hypothetical protein
VIHYAQIPTTKQFAMVFVCQLWRVSPLFCLPLARRYNFMMFQTPHMHTHVVKCKMMLPTSFPHFIFQVLNVLLNQKIIYTSFFSKELCIVLYLFMFLIYLLIKPLSNRSWIQAFNSRKMRPTYQDLHH